MHCGSVCRMLIIICFIDEWRRKLAWIRCGRFESALCFNNCDESSATSTDKPPPPLNLADCSARKWKLWKQTWLNYAVVSNFFQSRCSTPESFFSLHYRSRGFRDLKRVSIQCEWYFRYGGNLNLQIRRILQGGGKRNIWTLRSLTGRTKKLVKASTLISSLWETWRNLVTSAAAQQWATLYFETVSLLGFRMKMPGNVYFKKESSTWREVLRYAELWWKTWRVHQVHRRANDLSKKNRKQGEWTEASFEEKNTELRELKCKFCSQSHVLKKELCSRGVKGAMFAVK